MFVEASRPFVRAGGNANLTRSFSIAVPARKEGDMYAPKPRGFLAEVTPNASRPARREENHYAKAQQAEQMRALRYKVLQQRQTLEELDRFMTLPEHVKYSATHQGSGGPSQTFRDF